MILEEKQKKSRKHLFLATDPASRARFVAKICPEQTLSRSNVLCIVEPQYSVRDNVVKSNGKKVILGRHLTVSFFSRTIVGSMDYLGSLIRQVREDTFQNTCPGNCWVVIGQLSPMGRK